MAKTHPTEPAMNRMIPNTKATAARAMTMLSELWKYTNAAPHEILAAPPSWNENNDHYRKIVNLSVINLNCTCDITGMNKLYKIERNSRISANLWLNKIADRRNIVQLFTLSCTNCVHNHVMATHTKWEELEHWLIQQKNNKKMIFDSSAKIWVGIVMVMFRYPCS